MKKRNLLALLTLFGVTTVAAHTQNDTTIVVDHPTRVRIVETADQMKVSVEGTSGNSQFKLERTREIGKDGLSVNRERKEWDFNVPFLNKDREKRVGNISCHWPGFFIGFSTLTQKPAGIQSTFGSSVEIGFSPIQVQSPMLARNLRASWGLGFSWRNYRLTGHQRWVKNGSSLELAPYQDVQLGRTDVVGMAKEPGSSFKYLDNGRRTGELHYLRQCEDPLQAGWRETQGVRQEYSPGTADVRPLWRRGHQQSGLVCTLFALQSAEDRVCT